MPTPQTLSDPGPDGAIPPQASSVPPQIVLIFTVSIFFVLTWGFWILMNGNTPNRVPGSKGFRESPETQPNEPDPEASTGTEPGS
jgi:hypothetical protein